MDISFHENLLLDARCILWMYIYNENYWGYYSLGAFSSEKSFYPQMQISVLYSTQFFKVNSFKRPERLKSSCSSYICKVHLSRIRNEFRWVSRQGFSWHKYILKSRKVATIQYIQNNKNIIVNIVIKNNDLMNWVLQLAFLKYNNLSTSLEYYCNWNALVFVYKSVIVCYFIQKDMIKIQYFLKYVTLWLFVKNIKLKVFFIFHKRFARF